VIDMQSEDAPEALKEACTKYGFFYLANHGIDQALIDQVQ
jgi:isopenicillin N synthase-like dioxygenase